MLADPGQAAKAGSTRCAAGDWPAAGALAHSPGQPGFPAAPRDWPTPKRVCRFHPLNIRAWGPPCRRATARVWGLATVLCTSCRPRRDLMGARTANPTVCRVQGAFCSIWLTPPRLPCSGKGHLVVCSGLGVLGSLCIAGHFFAFPNSCSPSLASLPAPTPGSLLPSSMCEVRL
jgi:hypothetical protein